MSDRLPAEGSTQSSRGSPASRLPGQTEMENLIRETRRLLAGRRYAEIIEKLEVHRPAEWTEVPVQGVKMLRLLALAYLGASNFQEARDCLEHLRSIHHQRQVLGKTDHAAILSDLAKCYRQLQLPNLADQCQEEAKDILQSGE